MTALGSAVARRDFKQPIYGALGSIFLHYVDILAVIPISSGDRLCIYRNKARPGSSAT